MRLFRRKRNTFNVNIDTICDSTGIKIFIKAKDKRVDLPIRFTISELKQLNNLDELQLIDDLYAEEKLEKQAQGEYLISYDNVYQLEPDERKLLNIPSHTTPVSIELDNEGFVASSIFKFIPKIHSEEYSNLHKIGTRKGAIIELPSKQALLLEKPFYHFLESLENQPSRRKMDELAAFFARVKKEAKNLGITVNPYIESENYEFIDEVDIDLQRSDNGIEIIPEYKHEHIDSDTLKEVAELESGYKKNGNKRIFVNNDTKRTKEKINNLHKVENKDIPKFVQNPTAFIPEDIDIPLDSFGDRVKGLGIRVYRAQPYIHANKNEYGWFDFESGFNVKDNEGNLISSEGLEFFSEDVQEEFKQIDENTYIEIPNQVKEFREFSSKAKEEAEKQKSQHPNLSNYILEIFENITHVEYNKPLKKMREELAEGKVLDPTPPDTFKAILKPFQTDGFKWMKTLRLIGNGGLLADDMGLGKTVQVIAYLSYLKEQNKLSPSLIVLPKTLIDNWVKEMETFAPSLVKNTYIHMGSDRLKDPKIIGSYDIVLTTYHTLTRDQTTIALIDWEMVICDEAQAIKNPTTASSAVVKALKNKGRLALTGTPVENNLTELWSIIDFVQPGTLGSLKHFRNQYEKKLNEEKNYDEIQNAIEEKIKYIYLRRTKSGELEGQLPMKYEHPPILVSLGKEQQRVYETIVTQVKNNEMGGLQAIQKLKMLCSHPGLIDNEYKHIKANRVPKLAKTLDILQEIKSKDEKVLIFTEYIEMQGILKKEILMKYNVEAPIINGSTGHRQQVVDQFNSSSGFGVMILSPKAAGTGLTITGANHVIHYTRWWNPAVENQATDRVYRIGQEKDVHVYYPIVEAEGTRKTVEEIIDEVLTAKKSLAENVIVPSKGDSIEKEVLSEMSELVH